MKRILLFRHLLIFSLLCACSNSDDNTDVEPPIENTDPGSNIIEMYFPPIGSDIWETQNLEAINWNSTALEPLLNFLENSDTGTFMILYKGRIVTENYFNGSDANSNLPWFSAGKTLSAFMVGIAQEEGFLELTDSSSDYLGEGWTSLSAEQESQINVFHHLTMTSGLDYNVNGFCTDAECLNYLNPAGSFWYYHNAPYTLTQSIVSGAIEGSFDLYFKNKLRDPIGMQGAWVSSGFNRFYFSNARSMARFGLLCLNEGIWEDTAIMNDSSFFQEMVNTSQNLNEAYGYLWWLNGKNSFRVPDSIQQFSGKLVPNAPDDLIAGLGANDQKLYVVPSRDLVIVRQGGDAGSALLGPSSYDNELWSYISD
ncbi:MAG: serine hydrolase domain-containing protein, partial [Bacteroidota bacterium]